MTGPGDPSSASACSVAFKEWAGICDALADGRQSILLRKGGIAEEGGRFVPEHPAFWLYPTRLHESQQGLRAEAPSQVQSPPGTVPLYVLAVAEVVLHLDRETDLATLGDLHIWTDETIQKRFHYRTPGIWVLGVRAYRPEAPIVLEVTPEQAGCKTWVPLDRPITTAGLVPVLEDASHALRMDRLRELAAVTR
ncbi:DUF1802 family protein [Isosphaeraceae bacterium EP7]